MLTDVMSDHTGRPNVSRDGGLSDINIHSSIIIDTLEQTLSLSNVV